MTSVHWAVLVGFGIGPFFMACVCAHREAEADLARCPMDMWLMASAAAWKVVGVSLGVTGLLLTAYGGVSTFVLR